MEVISEPISMQVLSDLKLCLKSLRSETMTDTYLPQHACQKYSNSVHLKSDRFLINLYEKPTMCVDKRARRSFHGSTLTKAIIQPEKSKLWPSYDNSDNNNYGFCRNSDCLPKKKITMDQFIRLRSQRDVECIKLKEASNILQHLNKHSPYGNWFERLLAEKVLLESGHAVDLLKRKICEDYVYVKEKNVQVGTISLSSFKFHVNKQRAKHNETEFFVLLLSSDTEVKASKIQRAVNGDIFFDDRFTFPLTSNFKIKVQLHSILMKEMPKFFSLVKLFSWSKSQTQVFSKLQYKNLNTCDFEETQVLKTSFKLRAETEINPSNLHNKVWKLDLINTSIFDEFVAFSTNVDSFKIDYKRCGFLTLGDEFKDTVVWNRRWCVLDGMFLKIYNSPSEEGIVDPQLILNLVNCPLQIISEASRMFCNRPRCLILEIDESAIVNKYFFMADNYEDLQNWINSLNLILELLRFKSSLKL